MNVDRALARDRFARTGSLRGLRWLQTPTTTTIEIQTVTQLHQTDHKSHTPPTPLPLPSTTIPLPFTNPATTSPLPFTIPATISPLTSTSPQPAEDSVSGHDPGQATIGQGWASVGTGRGMVVGMGRVRRLSLREGSLFDVPEALLGRASVCVLATNFGTDRQLAQLRTLMGRLPTHSRVLTYLTSWEGERPRFGHWAPFAHDGRYLTSWASEAGYHFHLANKLQPHPVSPPLSPPSNRLRSLAGGAGSSGSGWRRPDALDPRHHHRAEDDHDWRARQQEGKWGAPAQYGCRQWNPPAGTGSDSPAGAGSGSGGAGVENPHARDRADPWRQYQTLQRVESPPHSRLMDIDDNDADGFQAGCDRVERDLPLI